MKIFGYLIILLMLFASCDDSSPEPEEVNPDPEENTADLVWNSFDATTVLNPQPGDVISVSINVKNLFDPEHPDDPDIDLNTTLRIYLENVNANSSTIGTFGPEDLVIAEIIVPALIADQTHSIVQGINIPNTGIFPTVVPANDTFSKDVISVTCKIYGILDAKDKVIERDETNNQTIATVLGSTDSKITITNPDQPNLQIKYYPGSSISKIQATGGASYVDWEILNQGARAILKDFNVAIFLTEDDVLDSYDPMISDFTVTDDISSYSSKIVKIPVTMPYVARRNNGWSLFSSPDKYNSSVGDVMITREPPPNGGAYVDFKVYPCIDSTSKLIAFVDSNQPNDINESNENDNYSYMIAGGNGELEAVVNNGGSLDIELSEVNVSKYPHPTANALVISLKYSAGINVQDYCSIGFYWSKDDKAQFGDYFCQRYWFSIQPGTDIVMYPFGANFVWRPDPLPAPGTYRMIVVMDDIFKFNESNENNNWGVSVNTITVN